MSKDFMDRRGPIIMGALLLIGGGIWDRSHVGQWPFLVYLEWMCFIVGPFALGFAIFMLVGDLKRERLKR